MDQPNQHGKMIGLDPKGNTLSTQKPVDEAKVINTAPWPEKVKGFPIHRASRTQNQLMMTGCSNYCMARTALLTLQRRTYKR